MESDEYYTRKCVLIGNSGTGKSSLLWAAGITNVKPSGNTIGIEFTTKIFKDIHGNNIKLQIWDVGGHDRYKSYIGNSGFIQDADIVLAVIDVTDRNSLHCLDTYWLSLLKTKKLGQSEQLKIFDFSSQKVYIIVNKIDQTNPTEKITFAEIDELAKKYNAKIIRTNATCPKIVTQLFIQIAGDVFVQVEENSTDKKKSSDKKKNSREKGCAQRLHFNSCVLI